MTQTPVTLESIDAKLEYIVSIMVSMADEQARNMRESNERWSRIEQGFEQSNERWSRIEQGFKESNDRLTRIEEITERQAKVAEEQAEIAKQQVEAARIQAESVRELIRVINQRAI